MDSRRLPFDPDTTAVSDALSGGRRGSIAARPRFMRLAAALAAAPLLGGCQLTVLDPKGPIGAGDSTILIDALVIMLAIVIPTAIATLAFAWWFRASNTKARYLPDWSYSGRLELVVWSIPILVVLFLGGIGWIGSHDLDPMNNPSTTGKKPLDVQVVSLDWKWLFIYPAEGVASLNQLVVPAGTPVHFHLTSASVMTAFFIPQLGSMIYTMNGMTTQLFLQADDPGTYLGLASHFSGDGFSGMNFKVDAMSDDAFKTWVQGARNSTQTLDEASYRELLKQSINVAPATFKATDPDLFKAIATQKLPPGPGPTHGRPTPDVLPTQGD